MRAGCSRTADKDVGAPYRRSLQWKTSRVDAFSSHNAHPATPIFINIKTIILNIRRDGSGQGHKRRMEAKCGGDQIDEWRFVTDLAVTKQFGRADVTAAAMGF